MIVSYLNRKDVEKAIDALDVLEDLDTDMDETHILGKMRKSLIGRLRYIEEHSAMLRRAPRLTSSPPGV